jgi:hypothetical protein
LPGVAEGEGIGFGVLVGDTAGTLETTGGVVGVLAGVFVGVFVGVVLAASTGALVEDWCEALVGAGCGRVEDGAYDVALAAGDGPAWSTRAFCAKDLPTDGRGCRDGVTAVGATLADGVSTDPLTPTRCASTAPGSSAALGRTSADRRFQTHPMRATRTAVVTTVRRRATSVRPRVLRRWLLMPGPAAT